MGALRAAFWAVCALALIAASDAWLSSNWMAQAGLGNAVHPVVSATPVGGR